MIVGNHNQLLWFISDSRITASVCRRHLCSATISGETDNYSCQARFTMDCVLNTSNDLGDDLILVIFFNTYRSGGPYFIIIWELCTYRVLCYPFPCLL